VIAEQMKDENWKSQQNPEFINAIQRVEATMNELTSYLYILVNYFDQYVDAVKTSPLFGPAPDYTESDDVSNAPTQTDASRDARVGAEDHV
jgi:hypothetical protein